MVLQFESMLLLQAVHSLLRIYLNAIITFIVIFSDGLIYAKTLEHFNLILDQLQCLKVTSDICSLFLTVIGNQELILNKKFPQELKLVDLI